MSEPDLFIIDAIGPFFTGYEKRVINWSKIPFVSFESGDGLDLPKVERIKDAFSQFIDRIVEQGFNAISIDDIAHMVPFDFYPEGLKRKIDAYRELYLSIFRMAKRKGVRIFVNSDIMFFTPSIADAVGNSVRKAIKLLNEAFVTLFSDYPVDGVILRVGETDGEDVLGDFKSRLLIKTPTAANRFIREILPTFEAFSKRLIFRTWTVGSYPIGDLIWNVETFRQAFAAIHSRNLIISMKYGDTDFFSSLELNPLFYQAREYQIILELQTRRERELFGNLPFYVGWDYEAFYRQVKALKNLVGISVWCQTGGWSRNNQLTFLENSSFWNELNTVASIRIFKDNQDADSVLGSHFNNPAQIDFVKQFHDLLLRILYIKGFASKTLFFRRTRIPPLIWLAWDYITVNPLIKAVYQVFTDQEVEVKAAEIEAVRERGQAAGIERIDFYCDTLQLFLKCVHSILGQQDDTSLQDAIETYRITHADCNLKFKLNGSSRNTWLKRLLPVLVRNRSDYRPIDRIMLNPVISLMQRIVLNRLGRDQLPKYANKRAMQADVLFK